MLKELLTRSAWLTLGSVLGRLLPLGVLVTASRHFEAQQFASASAGFAWAGVAMSLTSTGEATVMTQRLGPQTDAALCRGLFLRHASRALLLSSVLALAVCVAGSAGIRMLFGQAIHPAVLVPAAISGVLWSQVALCVAALNGSHASRRASLTLALCGLSQGLAMTISLLLFDSAYAMVWGLSCGSALALAVALSQVRQVLGPLLQHRATDAQSVRAFLGRIHVAANPVLWNTLATVAVLPVTFFASSLVARGPDGTRQLAQYFALEQVHQVLIYVPAMLGQALLPMVSRKMAGLGGALATAAFMRRMAQLAIVAAVVGLAVAALVGWTPGWLAQMLKNPSLGVQDGDAVRAMLTNASLALSLSLLGGAFVGGGNIVVAALLNLLWGSLVLALTGAWIGHGNAGLQGARVFASLALIVIGSLLLWQHERWSRHAPRAPGAQHRGTA